MTPVEVEIQQVRRHFSAHAEEYDRYAVVQKRVVKRLLQHLPRLKAEDGPVLDLGCGTGELAAGFARMHPGLPLVAADIAHGMTRHAALAVPGVLPLDADAVELPLRSASCGVLLSASMYQWVNNLPEAFREAARILRPGGLFLGALFGSGTLRELRQAHAAALAESGPGALAPMQDFPSASTVAAALTAAGFTAPVEVYDEVEYHPDVATLLHNLKRIGAQNASRHRPSGLAGRKTLRMISHYTDRFGEEHGIPASYEVVSFVARKGENR